MIFTLLTRLPCCVILFVFCHFEKYLSEVIEKTTLTTFGTHGRANLTVVGFRILSKVFAEVMGSLLKVFLPLCWVRVFAPQNRLTCSTTVTPLVLLEEIRF